MLLSAIGSTSSSRNVSDLMKLLDKSDRSQQEQTRVDETLKQLKKRALAPTQNPPEKIDGIRVQTKVVPFDTGSSSLLSRVHSEGKVLA